MAAQKNYHQCPWTKRLDLGFREYIGFQDLCLNSMKKEKRR